MTSTTVGPTLPVMRPGELKMCGRHYKRWLRNGTTNSTRDTRRTSCIVRGCVRTEITGRGMCRFHHKRWLRHGDPRETLYRR